MQNLNALSIRTLDDIHSPTPHIPTPLIQLHPTQRRPHFQPRKPAHLARLALPRPRLAVPHHHGAEPTARPRRMRENGPDTRTVGVGVAFCWHPEKGRCCVPAIERFAEGPAAAGADGRGLRSGVEDEVGSGWGLLVRCLSGFLLVLCRGGIEWECQWV